MIIFRAANQFKCVNDESRAACASHWPVGEGNPEHRCLLRAFSLSVTPHSFPERRTASGHAQVVVTSEQASWHWTKMLLAWLWASEDEPIGAEDSPLMLYLLSALKVSNPSDPTH
jgi:hypothetical protein